MAMAGSTVTSALIRALFCVTLWRWPCFGQSGEGEELEPPRAIRLTYSVDVVNARTQLTVECTITTTAAWQVNWTWLYKDPETESGSDWAFLAPDTDKADFKETPPAADDNKSQRYWTAQLKSSIPRAEKKAWSCLALYQAGGVVGSLTEIYEPKVPKKPKAVPGSGRPDDSTTHMMPPGMKPGGEGFIIWGGVLGGVFGALLFAALAFVIYRKYKFSLKGQVGVTEDQMKEIALAKLGEDALTSDKYQAPEDSKKGPQNQPELISLDSSSPSEVSESFGSSDVSPSFVESEAPEFTSSAGSDSSGQSQRQSSLQDQDHTSVASLVLGNL